MIISCSILLPLLIISNIVPLTVTILLISLVILYIIPLWSVKLFVLMYVIYSLISIVPRSFLIIICDGILKAFWFNCGNLLVDPPPSSSSSIIDSGICSAVVVDGTSAICFTFSNISVLKDVSNVVNISLIALVP